MDKDEILAIIIILALIVLPLYGTYFFIKQQCLQSYSEYQPEYSLLTKCRVMHNGKITPVDIIREMN
jgi:hypothetical protein